LSVKSPVHEPLLEEEPLLDFWSVNVDVLIKASHHEHLVIVVNWISPEELLGLL